MPDNTPPMKRLSRAEVETIRLAALEKALAQMERERDEALARAEKAEELLRGLNTCWTHPGGWQNLGYVWGEVMKLLYERFPPATITPPAAEETANA